MVPVLLSSRWTERLSSPEIAHFLLIDRVYPRLSTHGLTGYTLLHRSGVLVRFISAVCDLRHRTLMQYTICRSLHSHYDGIIERTYILYSLCCMNVLIVAPRHVRLNSYRHFHYAHCVSVAKRFCPKLAVFWQVCQWWLIYTVACGRKNRQYPHRWVLPQN